MTTAVGPLVIAAPVRAQASAERRFDIPAQPLSDALVLFAAQSGYQVATDGATIQGIRTNGVRGVLVPASALSQLLSGTGFTFRVSGNVVSLERAPQAVDGAIQLGPVRVEGESNSGRSTAFVSITSDPGATEGTGSYMPRTTNTATKLALTPRETPQTVTVVTRQQMDDFAMTSVDDALRATSGVVVYERGANGGDYYSRGFSMQSQYDGIPNPVGISENNKSPQVDNAFLDRLEILQGASGLMSGAGFPGGTINLVRKRPTNEFQAHVEGQLGSWKQRRVVGDLSGPILSSGSVRGRVVALMDDGDSFIDYAYNKRRSIYGIVEADITLTTTVTGSIQYQEDNGRNHLGVPFGSAGGDIGLRRSIFFGNPTSRVNKEYVFYTFGVEQSLFSDWTFSAKYAIINNISDQRNYSYLYGSLNNATGDGLILAQNRRIYQDLNSHMFDVFFNGSMRLFGGDHSLVFGANGSSLKRESQVDRYYSTIINVYAFDPSSLSNPAAGALTFGGTTTSQEGIYGVGRFDLADSLKLITGLRVSWYKSMDLVTDVISQEENAVISPYGGLIYDFSNQFSAYISYSDIFNPQSQRALSGGMLKPVVGSNYELGIKGELLDGRLNVATALFRLEQTNLARLDTSIPYDPSNLCEGYCYSADDKVISRGVELSVNGEIQNGWSVAAGYTYLQSEYATGNRKGEAYMTRLPRHSFRVSTNYALPGTSLSVGGSVRAMSKIYNTDYVGIDLRRGSLVIAGLTAKYQFNSDADLVVVVDNIFDHRYYASVDRPWWVPFGEPRSFSASFKYRF